MRAGHIVDDVGHNGNESIGGMMEDRPIYKARLIPLQGSNPKFGDSKIRRYRVVCGREVTMPDCRVHHCSGLLGYADWRKSDIWLFHTLNPIERAANRARTARVLGYLYPPRPGPPPESVERKYCPHYGDRKSRRAVHRRLP